MLPALAELLLVRLGVEFGDKQPTVGSLMGRYSNPEVRMAILSLHRKLRLGRR